MEILLLILLYCTAAAIFMIPDLIITMAILDHDDPRFVTMSDKDEFKLSDFLINPLLAVPVALFHLLRPIHRIKKLLAKLPKVSIEYHGKKLNIKKRLSEVLGFLATKPFADK